MNIGLTQRIDFIDSRNEYRDSIDRSFYNLCKHLNYSPINIPNINININEFIKNLNIHALILTGGNSIFLDDEIVDNYSIERDNFERSLIKEFYGKIPIVGICRGMQMLNIYFGGKIKIVKNHINAKHKIFSEKKYDLPEYVNSFHKWGIPEKYLSKEFDAIAYDADRNIESFLNLKKKTLGIMWHPERDKIINLKNIKIIKRILK